MTAKSSRILIVGPAWVGDMVMAQSLFITLKQQDPNCIIDVIAPGWSVPVLKRMPEVDEAIELPVGHKQLQIMTRYRIGKTLRKKNYDRAIVTPRSFKSALVPFFARARQRTGYRGEMRFGLLNDIRPLDKSVLTQTVQRQVALGLPANSTLPPVTPFPKLTIDIENQHQLVKKLNLKTDKPVVGFMPGAEYGPAKQWPIEYFTGLATKLVADGKYVWVFGSGKEQISGKLISDNNDQVTNLCGQTELVDVIDLIALTDTVVSNDSGLMHVACATGRKVIGIYGSSSPDYTPPLANDAAIFYKKLDCSPCFERVCRFGHYNCLKNITVNEVLSLINK